MIVGSLFFTPDFRNFVTNLFLKNFNQALILLYNSNFFFRLIDDLLCSSKGGRDTG